MLISPDLEFTKDPQWISQRLERWKPIEAFLKEDNRRERVLKIKNAFLTGVCEDFGLARGGSIVLYFPLQEAEGWDFAFMDERVKPEVFKRYFYNSLTSDYEEFFWDQESRLRFFDYFHPKSYQSVIKSRVPIGRNQKIIELKIDLYDLLAKQLSGLILYVEDGFYTPIIDRQAYFFSGLDKVGDVGPHGVGPAPKCGRIIKRLLKARFQLLGQKVGEKEDKKLEFLDELYSHIANNPVDPSIKKIWQEVVAEYE
ncbi:hypothetical protein [Microbulbifer sp. JTAC008]|uniref:hypothetical protein n=1 Tax=unclassified Microbulbifer TaxID=2619833 RepID=UPI0040392FFD